MEDKSMKTEWIEALQQEACPVCARQLYRREKNRHFHRFGKFDEWNKEKKKAPGAD
jgi:hypothetical protein